MSITELATVGTKPSLLQRFGGRFGVDPVKLLDTLKATTFKGANNEQMMALLIVADQYGLNPFVKEIYAFPDKGGIVPVVGVDGWHRIINEHPQFDGLDFTEGPVADGGKLAGLPEWIECVMHRKDRAHPVRVREYMAECWRNAGPWQSHPRRMLRHKALIQCARVAFSFAGIHDEDEAMRIVEPAVTTTSGGVSKMAALVEATRKAPEAPPAVEPANVTDPRAEALARAAEMARDGQDRAMVGAYLDGTELFSEEGVADGVAKVFGK